MSGERLFCWLQSERNSLNISSASSLKIQGRKKGIKFWQHLAVLWLPSPNHLHHSITRFCHSCDIPSLHQSFSVCLIVSPFLSDSHVFSRLACDAGKVSLEAVAKQLAAIGLWVKFKAKKHTMLDGVCVCAMMKHKVLLVCAVFEHLCLHVGVFCVCMRL